jgi:hypothetical protein
MLWPNGARNGAKQTEISPMNELTKEQAILAAPSDAFALKYRGNGIAAFYSDAGIRLNEIRFRPSGPEPRWLAFKGKDGKWHWYRSKGDDAIAALEALGWRWDIQQKKWIPQSDAPHLIEDMRDEGKIMRDEEIKRDRRNALIFVIIFSAMIFIPLFMRLCNG